MAKSKIIKDLATGICGLDVALNRLYLISTSIQDNKVSEWIKRELNGYGEEDELPHYRQVKARLAGDYQTVGWGKIWTSTHVELPTICFSYYQINGTFDSSIFAESKATGEFKNAFKATKHIRDYVFVDGINKDSSTERRFAEDLDRADEVCVYTKLPKSFYIPTPVGNYSPDWAIAFNEGSVKHIYFVAETKGSLDTLQLKGIEGAKIECAKKLYNKMSSSKVRYEYVTKYSDLLDKMNGLD